MSTAKIEFKIPDEQEEFDCCMSAPRLDRALRDIYEKLRAHRKYDGPVFDEVMFWNILEENDIKLFDS